MTERVAAWATRAYVVFAIIGPVALSIVWVRLFLDDDEWMYPFTYPLWSFGVTILKISVMIVWLLVRRRSSVGGYAWTVVTAVVFLIGALHAMTAALSNLLLSFWIPVGLSVAGAFLSGLFYLHACHEVCRGFSSREPVPFSVTLAVVVIVAILLAVVHTCLHH